MSSSAGGSLGLGLSGVKLDARYSYSLSNSMSLRPSTLSRCSRLLLYQAASSMGNTRIGTSTWQLWQLFKTKSRAVPSGKTSLILNVDQSSDCSSTAGVSRELDGVSPQAEKPMQAARPNVAHAFRILRRKRTAERPRHRSVRLLGDHQNGVQPPSRNCGGTTGSGLVSLKFSLRYANRTV